MNSRNAQLRSLIQRSLNWDAITTKKGDTQKAERNYIPVVIECIEKLGGTGFKSAGSQQAIDIQNVTWPDGTTVDYEGKKVDSKNSPFHFNDTFLKNDVYYILIYGGNLRRVRIEKGSTLIQESEQVEAPKIRHHLKELGNLIVEMLSDDKDINSENIKKFFNESFNLLKSSVIHGIVSYYDFGEMFKNTIKFGNFSSRPRPNWNLKIPYVEPEATFQPPQQSEEAPHSPTEQPSSCDCPPNENLSETLESPSSHQPEKVEDSIHLNSAEPQKV